MDNNINCHLAHVGITVSDIDISIDWYETNFDSELVRRFDKPDLKLKGATIKIHSCLIELLQPYEPERLEDNAGDLSSLLKKPGANHLAFATADINGLYEKLKQNNVTFVTDFNPGCSYFFCLDPDNTLIEINPVRSKKSTSNGVKQKK